MKKILRTRLQYNCDKREDFDYVEREYKFIYDRSYDMYVSASTKEECEAVMESFEDAIRAEGIQDSFDSNLEPEFDKNKNLWVGAVEVYVGNDYVADEKEAIKEVYNEWKRYLKATPVVIETKEIEETPAPATGYVSQEERVEIKKEKLVVDKTYSVDDGAGTKMQIIRKENGVWWGTEGLWNLFNSFNLDYQEYILDLIPENTKE